MVDQEVTISMEPAFVPDDQIEPPLKKEEKVPGAPSAMVPTAPGKKRLIFNIETLGVNPLKNRIITIGFQDSEDVEGNPTVIMLDSEEQMLRNFLQILLDGEYNELVGYNLGFDYRYILLRCMYYNIPCKEFFDCELYDLMQAVQQGKLAFVYNPQKAPNLSDVSDFLFNYPKPFTDEEMIAFYEAGEYDKVLLFASSQITRTLVLYWTYRNVSENSFQTSSSGMGGAGSSSTTPPPGEKSGQLTISEVSAPEFQTWKCPVCLAEIKLAKGETPGACAICGNVMEKI